MDLSQLAKSHAGHGLESAIDELADTCATQQTDLGWGDYLGNYKRAYQEEKNIFCAQRLTFEYGLQGGSYEDICEENAEGDYQLGYEVFEMRYDIWALENKIKNRERRISSYGNDQQRDAVRDYQREIRSLNTEIGWLRLELIELKKEAKSRGFNIE